MAGRPARLPYLEEIAASGSNALAGVTRFEDGSFYAHTQSDASKAYSDTVLQQQRGFIRDLVMLRNPSGQPTGVVFDAVRTSGTTMAISLLQFTDYVVNLALTAPFIKPGRKQFPPSRMTVRRACSPRGAGWSR